MKVESAKQTPPPRTDFLAHRLSVHGTLLVIAIAVLTAAAVLRINADERVVAPVVNWELPGTCTFRRLFATDCPGCGLTRCFISAADGNLEAAWSFNPLGIVMFALVLGQIPFRLLQIWRIRSGTGELRFHRAAEWTMIALAVGLFLQWVFRLLVSSA